ncbi:UDP-N-acetylglucosamine--N-acetylmuramyl-(pentapeptide) pyrophosphoryl-undecaprenol N-acetylglucosamine transferase [Methylobacterium crusticola]|uniref:UDP-N-acetylglucosamine--N-acetylmuramyl-(Pentapeptide) pyrophosphoryl-undecaprenol N-acetylglucosamine transferase n=3 Tax=Methylobacterium crusticola TaxID=1697972 RepID=A0ABQ4R3C3_9HYPH|nr:UDP-2,4-diacetamido-2,4,6-trideoxy-beta-L-altropyranose hydrolase [Methylobacterium crusticola]GJD51932.1 UDP-N-acetylglucosamine--N-acetylmuramyl-(pentapeptide) pyrophosphoryl-undecaprenol N-acetylglucosamine transferase [Methylobacterium crusticola]
MSERRHVLVRAEADARVGGGHVMRCLALAAALRGRGHAVTVCAGPQAVRAVPALAASGLPVVAEPVPADVVVVDHYGLALAEEDALRRAAGAALLVAIDDLADRMHGCDLLLDAGAGRDPSAYAGLIPGGAVGLFGPRHALLRPDFAALRPASPRRPRGLARIAVAFGLSDATPHVAATLAALARAAPAAAVDLVTGPAGAGAAAALAAGRPGVRLHVDPPDYPAILAAADLAIGAAGGSAWERCALALPSIAVPIAPNQAGNARALARHGAALVVAPGPGLGEGLAAALAALGGAPDALAALGRQAAGLCDGRGAERVAEAIEALRPVPAPGPVGRLSLRPAGPADARMLWVWRNDPLTRAMSRSSDAVAWEGHGAWLRTRLAEPGRTRLLVAEADGEPAGSLRLDRLPDGVAAEVSLTVSPLLRGRGLGARLLAALCGHAADTGFCRRLAAAVRADNAASRTVFERAGFRLVQAGTPWLRYERSLADG